MQVHPATQQRGDRLAAVARRIFALLEHERAADARGPNRALLELRAQVTERARSYRYSSGSSMQIQLV